MLLILMKRERNRVRKRVKKNKKALKKEEESLNTSRGKK